MSHPGTKSPRNHLPKAEGSDPGSRMEFAPLSKMRSEAYMRMGQAVSDVGAAPTSRVYTRDYSKVGREPDDVDLVTGALGNPLGR